MSHAIVPDRAGARKRAIQYETQCRMLARGIGAALFGQEIAVGVKAAAYWHAQADPESIRLMPLAVELVQREIAGDFYTGEE